MYHGTVKWFNNAKGYGFIVSDSFDEDLFTHYSSINVDGYKTLKAGQAVTFETQPGKNGLHAVDITAIPSEKSNSSEMESSLTDSAPLSNNKQESADYSIASAS